MYSNENQQYSDDMYGFEDTSQMYVIQPQDHFTQVSNNIGFQNITGSMQNSMLPMNQLRQPGYMGHPVPSPMNKPMMNGLKPNMPNVSNVQTNAFIGIGPQRSLNYIMQPQVNQWQSMNYPGQIYQKPLQRPSIINETNNLLIQQFKLTINTIKNQNKQTIEKLQRQNQKIINNFQYIKSLIEKGELIVEKKEYNEQQIISQSNRYLNDSNYNYPSNMEHNSTHSTQANPYRPTQSQKEILKKKIMQINQKKRQNIIKLENQQNVPTISSQKDQQINKNAHNPSTRNQRDSLSPQQTNNLNNLNPKNQQQKPQYPQDFYGQQSFLVNEQIIRKQKQINERKNITDPAKFQFGISQYDKQIQKNIAYKSKFTPKNDQQVKKQSMLIEKFLDQFLCEKMQYAPKKVFNQFKINRLELYQIYWKWKHYEVKDKNLMPKVQPKVIQMRLSTQFRKRFTSCGTDKTSYIGVKFKDENQKAKLLPKRLNH